MEDCWAHLMREVHRSARVSTTWSGIVAADAELTTTGEMAGGTRALGCKVLDGKERQN